MEVILAIQNNDTRLALELLLSEEPKTVVVATLGGTDDLLAVLNVVLADVVIVQWSGTPAALAELISGIRMLPSRLKILVISEAGTSSNRFILAGADDAISIGTSPHLLLRHLHNLDGS